jgi:hypothetical protein
MTTYIALSPPWRAPPKPKKEPKHGLADRWRIDSEQGLNWKKDKPKKKEKRHGR